MGKGYKRKTRWRTLDIGAPPGEEDEEDGKRNGYIKGQENKGGLKKGQVVHKTGRTDSAGSSTSDYASDYASAVSKSRRDKSRGTASQPKIRFNENEYTRITTPRQDVLFKKGYFSSKKVWASTTSMSATPSTTESQSASHSTADGSETTEDQQLLDCIATEYPAMMEPGVQVTYGTFYDHASGYYYEYPVMVFGPEGAVPNGPPMHDVLTAVPCGPVPLRPIKWVNPAFVPKYVNEQYGVVDYQTAQIGQYPALVDGNEVPLAGQTENSNGSDEAYQENGTGSASCTDSVGDEEQQTGNSAETQNGTTEASLTDETEEIAQAPVNSEAYLETALAQQLHVTHAPLVPPPPPLYVYPGHYMFGPSLVNVNGVTIQSGGPIIRNPAMNGAPANNGAWSKRKKKKSFSRRKWGQPLGPENMGEDVRPGGIDEADGTGNGSIDSSYGEFVVGTSQSRVLNPECQEFRPVTELRTSITGNESRSSDDVAENGEETRNFSELSSSVENGEDDKKIVERSLTLEKSESNVTSTATVTTTTTTTLLEDNTEDGRDPKNNGTTLETEAQQGSAMLENGENLVSRKSEEKEGAPVDFAAEVFANVSIMAERALARHGVVEGTLMETEIGLDATSIDFEKIVEKLGSQVDDNSQEDKALPRNGLRLDRLNDNEETVPNGMDDGRISSEKSSPNDLSTDSLEMTAFCTANENHRTTKDKRGSRSASPGTINRTTTPINANSQRLPKSYESLVIRSTSDTSFSSNSSVGQSRNRKYSSKTPKFVREPTPGPDLDELQTSCIQVVEERIANNGLAKSDNATRNSHRSLDHDAIEREAIATGEEALENELQRYSLSTNEDSCHWRKSGNPDASNDDSGIESQTRFSSSEHPITDAVTEWLQRANSPEMFVTGVGNSASEPEDDELENDEPPKNLQGNPMPALSANSGDANNQKLSRLASYGKFADFTNASEVTTSRSDENTKENHEKTMLNGNENIDTTSNNKSSISRRKKRNGGARKVQALKNAFIKASNEAADARGNVDVDVEAARQRLAQNSSSSESENEKMIHEVCELTENDSVAGMRVAKSSRTKNIPSVTTSAKTGVPSNQTFSNNGIAPDSTFKDNGEAFNEENGKKKTTLDSTNKKKKTESNEEEGTKHKVGEKTKRRTRRNNKKSKNTVMSSRDVPVENVEIKLRIIPGEDEATPENDEIRIRTFEKGEIVVSNEGKILPVDNYQPILLKNMDSSISDCGTIEESIKYRKITCEKSLRNENDEESTSESASKRNSLGSIEEPDVLECWEIETVEPIVTPKRIQTRGRYFEGEDATEDDNNNNSNSKNNKTNEATMDSTGMEIVRKYYRLEAMTASIDDLCLTNNCNDNDLKKNSILDNNDRMFSSISSDEVPVIGDKMSKIVESMLEKSGLPIEEALEAYESCYGSTEKQQQQQLPRYLGFDTKFRIRRLYGQDPEREGAVPCKAACCNIQ